MRLRAIALVVARVRLRGRAWPRAGACFGDCVGLPTLNVGFAKQTAAVAQTENLALRQHAGDLFAI
eukprot:11195628-Lingulodinium_polyedra.AAC.1